MLPPDITYDHELFTGLQRAFTSGALSRERGRLAATPRPLAPGDPRLRPYGRSPAALSRGEAAIRGGRVAALILNGGLATRFGGAVKGVVPVVPGRPDRSFLALKLEAVAAIATRLGGAIPAIVMSSFATREASLAHLEAIAWAGIPAAERLAFDQSVLPRVDVDGRPLFARPGADALPSVELFAAPGHGDTLRAAVESGLVDRLRARGVEHVLVCNVDNLGATLDPVELGRHLEAVDGGAEVSIEVVARAAGDVGGCVAELGERPAIVEWFRMPEGADPATYHYFNTNTLWLTIDALASRPPLDYFPVRREVTWPDGQIVHAVQFEQLIGQISEHAPTAFLEVDRARRFVPIKTREDLAAAGPWIAERFARSRPSGSARRSAQPGDAARSSG